MIGEALFLSGLNTGIVWKGGGAQPLPNKIIEHFFKELFIGAKCQNGGSWPWIIFEGFIWLNSNKIVFNLGKMSKRDQKLIRFLRPTKWNWGHPNQSMFVFRPLKKKCFPKQWYVISRYVHTIFTFFVFLIFKYLYFVFSIFFYLSIVFTPINL